MKCHLLFRDKDFDWRWALQAAAKREALRSGRRYSTSSQSEGTSALPWNAEVLTADLALETLFGAMSQGDDIVFEVARRVVLDGVCGDLDTIRYRQEVLQDCIQQPGVVKNLYAVTLEVKDKQKPHYLGVLTRYPNYVLNDAIEAMTIYLLFLRKLRSLADAHADNFISEGWTRFFAMLKSDLDEGYLDHVTEHLEELRLRHGELISAELGRSNKGSHYLLHRTPAWKRSWAAWWSGLFEDKPPAYRFELHPRDEAGFQALATLRNRGISLAASALGKESRRVCQRRWQPVTDCRFADYTTSGCRSPSSRR
jgi:hypothetical protein